MSGVQMVQMLAEMRKLAATADVAPVEQPASGGQGFGELLKASMDAVNQAQTTAQDIAAALERGDANVGLPEGMIALQKASLSFRR